MKRKRGPRSVLILLALLGALLGALLTALALRRALEVDRCLDAGGRWSERARRCER